MAAARMMIRYHFQKKLHSDDFVLMFACLTFLASQVLLYILKVDNVHRFGAVFFEPSPQTTASIYEDHKAPYRSLSQVQHMEYSIGILTWTSIFAVKICFLLFFHQMILRTQRLLLAWRVIFGITIIFWVLCSCGFFISCPRFGQAACKSAFALPYPIPLHIDQKHLILCSELFTRYRIFSKPCCEHHGSCSRYRFRLAP